MTEYDYYVAEDNDFARVFRVPQSEAGPVEAYEAKNSSWRTEEYITNRATLDSVCVRIPQLLVPREIKICHLMLRAAQQLLRAYREEETLHVSLNSIYVNN